MRPYVIVLLTAFVSRLLLEFFRVPYVTSGQRVLWGWPFFVVLVAALAMGAYALRHTRDRERHDDVVARRKFGWPIIVGTVVAAAIIISDVIEPVAEARGVPTIHVPLPIAIPFYLYGGILLSVLFHFAPLALILGLTSRVRPGIARSFIIAAVVAVALSEDGGYFIRNGFDATPEGARHLVSVAANAAEVMFMWRFGFLAGLTQRLSTYTWWHILWPAVRGA